MKNIMKKMVNAFTAIKKEICAAFTNKAAESVNDDYDVVIEETIPCMNEDVYGYFPTLEGDVASMLSDLAVSVNSNVRHDTGHYSLLVKSNYLSEDICITRMVRPMSMSDDVLLSVCTERDEYLSRHEMELLDKLVKKALKERKIDISGYDYN